LAAVVLLLVVAVAAEVLLLVRAIGKQRTPSELRGDWWSAFEREFRAYARTSTSCSPDRRRGQAG
jgi:hypothetical protein